MALNSAVRILLEVLPMNLAIGKNIKKLREVRNVTQEQLASALNISFQAVSKWENDVAVPDTVIVSLALISENSGLFKM
jgi:transcriptional regulator with XRE-family HTH domain